MPTVYERLLKFYQKDKFRFKPHGKMTLGRRISDLWKTTIGSELPLKQSEEDGEIFNVFDYPEDFTGMIDQAIRIYHKDILEASKKKKLSFFEVPKHSPAPIVPEPSPIKKERKRIPAKSKPVWSTNTNK